MKCLGAIIWVLSWILIIRVGYVTVHHWSYYKYNHIMCVNSKTSVYRCYLSDARNVWRDI